MYPSEVQSDQNKSPANPCSGEGDRGSWDAPLLHLFCTTVSQGQSAHTLSLLQVKEPGDQDLSHSGLTWPRYSCHLRVWRLGEHVQEEGRKGGPLMAGREAIIRGASHVLTIPLWLQTCILHSAKRRLGLNIPFLLRWQVNNHILFPGISLGCPSPTHPPIPKYSSPHSTGIPVVTCSPPCDILVMSYASSGVVSWEMPSRPTDQTWAQLRVTLVLPSLHLRV